MRIGLVTADFHPNVGGVAAHVGGLGRTLASLGHTVHVISIPLGGERDLHSERDGMLIHRPPIPKAQPLFNRQLGRWLRTFLRQTPLDILHVHGVRPLTATRGLDVPVLFTNHTSGFLKRVEKGAFQCWRLRRRLAHLSHVIAPSPERVEAVTVSGYPGPVDFIPNGVDPHRFSPGPSARRQTLGANLNDTVVLLPSRLVEVKGVLVFAEAVNRTVSQNVRFVVAGDGPLRPDMERILRAGQKQNSVHFSGSVPNSDMPDIYRAADISVLSSFMEATSIAGLESMACGLPLIGTRVGGIPTLIRHGKTGLLVDPHDPAALAESMDRLIADPNLRTAMGQAARQRVVDHFAWEQIATRTVEIYRKYAAGTETSAASPLRTAG